jgi:hypothetical protein
MCTVGIVDPSVARAHEEVGLREPSHRTTEMLQQLIAKTWKVCPSGSLPSKEYRLSGHPMDRCLDSVYRAAWSGLLETSQRAHRKPILIVCLRARERRDTAGPAPPESATMPLKS